MGFDKDQVLIVKSPYDWTDRTKIGILRQRMYDYAASDPGIKDITSASFIFAGYNFNAYEINDEFKERSYV